MVNTALVGTGPGREKLKRTGGRSTGQDGSGKRKKHTKTVKACGNTLEAQEKEARRQLALFIAEIEKARSLHPARRPWLSFLIIGEEHYALRHHEKKTIARNCQLFKRLEAALGAKRIDRIEPKDILAFMKNLREPGIRKPQNKDASPECLSPETVRKHYVLLHTLLGQATKWGMIPYNTASKVERPRVVRTPKQIPDEEALGKFLNTLDRHADTEHQTM